VICLGEAAPGEAGEVTGAGQPRHPFIVIGGDRGPQINLVDKKCLSAL
jgi:hypothetical protein